MKVVLSTRLTILVTCTKTEMIRPCYQQKQKGLKMSFSSCQKRCSKFLPKHLFSCSCKGEFICEIFLVQSCTNWANQHPRVASCSTAFLDWRFKLVFLEWYIISNGQASSFCCSKNYFPKMTSFPVRNRGMWIFSGNYTTPPPKLNFWALGLDWMYIWLRHWPPWMTLSFTTGCTECHLDWREAKTCTCLNTSNRIHQAECISGNVQKARINRFRSSFCATSFHCTGNNWILSCYADQGSVKCLYQTS